MGGFVTGSFYCKNGCFYGGGSLLSREISIKVGVVENLVYVNEVHLAGQEEMSVII